MLSGRNASSPARARRRWEFHRALVAAARRSPKASGWFRPGSQRASDGGQLRSRSCAVLWHPAAGHVRHLRGYRGTLGELVAARPCGAIGTQASNLRRLKALYIDCGEKDQFNLLYGARRFVRRLNELGIAHRYEEFSDNHTGVAYRMDESLPFLAQALSG